MNKKIKIDFITADWQAPNNVKTIATTRFGGISTTPFDNFNLALHVGDKSSDVLHNRLLLQKLLPASPNWLNQIHGTKIIQLPNIKYLNKLPNADASFSLVKNTICVVLTADCLPVFFSNKNGSKVAIAHAGWRGLANGILEKTAQQITSNPSELFVWLAPAIGQQNFEVNKEIRTTFVENFADTTEAFISLKNNKFLADIYQIARLRLQRIGVRAITGGNFDTFSNELFFSYRAQKVTGRMANLIWFE